MKKLLLALTVLSGITFSSFAQTMSFLTKDVKFNIGAESGLPVGDASNIYSAVIGGSLKCEIPAAIATYLTISAGYNSFLTKSTLNDRGVQSSFGFIPVKAGIKGYFNSYFFIEAQAGAVFSTASYGGDSFAWSAGLGYTFDGGFEAGIRYEDWTHTRAIAQAALRLAYRF